MDRLNSVLESQASKKTRDFSSNNDLQTTVNITSNNSNSNIVLDQDEGREPLMNSHRQSQLTNSLSITDRVSRFGTQKKQTPQQSGVGKSANFLNPHSSDVYGLASPQSTQQDEESSDVSLQCSQHAPSDNNVEGQGTKMSDAYLDIVNTGFRDSQNDRQNTNNGELSDGDSSTYFKAAILSSSAHNGNKEYRLSKHYRKSILQESERSRSRHMSRAQSRTSSNSSLVTTGSRSASLLKKELAESLVEDKRHRQQSERLVVPEIEEEETKEPEPAKNLGSAQGQQPFALSTDLKKQERIQSSFEPKDGNRFFTAMKAQKQTQLQSSAQFNYNEENRRTVSPDYMTKNTLITSFGETFQPSGERNRSGTMTSLQETEQQHGSFSMRGNFLSGAAHLMSGVSGGGHNINQTMRRDNGPVGSLPPSEQGHRGLKNDNNLSQKAMRVARVKQYVENNDVESFRFMMLSRREYINMRFNYNMNLLQLVCFEEANFILDTMRHKFANDEAAKKEMAQHKDSHMGSQAIHLAAATGNRYMIEVLMLDFLGDPYENTIGQQSVMHCAAQKYEGVLSIFLFARCHNIGVTHADRKGATALHFATISMHIKNVQALIKLGADVNAQDHWGNTCLHLCISTMAEKINYQEMAEQRGSGSDLEEEDLEDERIYEDVFEKLKEIGKELLFSGASRDIQNNQGLTPLDMLNEHPGMLKPGHMEKMRYVLTTPGGCKCLRLTRPIEKVERTTSTQVCMLLFDIITMSFFVIAASYNQSANMSDGNEMQDKIAVFFNTIFFVLAILFYCLTLIDPGYVPLKKDFLGLMERLVDEELHLDYICINCENLRPENTMHCNYCNKCVQGFDHHCTFVNNCLGYKNHKYFLLFLLFFMLYMIAMIYHSIFSLCLIFQGKAYSGDDNHVKKLKISINLYLLIVILFHCPIVLLQLYSQLRKLCRQNPIPDPNWEGDGASTGRRSTMTGSVFETGTHYDRSSSRGGMMLPPKSLAWCYNLKTIFAYKPQSQEYLYHQLFEDSDRKSVRGSLIFNHMQVVDEIRLGDTGSITQGHLLSSPQSPSQREASVLQVPLVHANQSFREVPVAGLERTQSSSEENQNRHPNMQSMVPDMRKTAEKQTLLPVPVENNESLGRGKFDYD